jgi:hypothetical protein
MPLILEPGQRQAFQFYNFKTNFKEEGEFLHIKICDEQMDEVDIIEEEPSLNNLEKLSKPIRKKYNWSSPFFISQVKTFSVKLSTEEIEEDDLISFANIKSL